ncbi:3-phosphoshikimate 1-carboxyvinyltransferase [Nocardioides daphniae]|uniref:3-phosphoshikimate 1-carboxyvinyltransferase n=1 Tax=Nocardioides daphniae TaxID=402297 RepID=A0A4P7UC94_9ACTN|nr:3-phosphoshikimate 1-carboxyvinyltransferase [Nocardioides daphniae]QCC77760.1 3-phosphoshikimate 1-carboxyvinyltransferase [Nocardioides daphniae]GGD28692.1 3-phosphoshikimate 1-carboxyvinyltransferase 1 [Nocardioides daphniae]
MSLLPDTLDPWPAPFASAPVDLVVDLPGSKSLTNRALILAALADGPSVVRKALHSRDTLLMAGALSSLGAEVDTDGDDWHVTPAPLGSSAPTDDRRVDCGLAGTVMRFVPPLAALVPGVTAFDGDPHMRNRPVGEMLAALRALGVRVDDGGSGGLPFAVHGTGSVRGGRVVLDASASSQFISALLLVGARFDEGVEVVHSGAPVPSLPHIEMTVQLLRHHGVAVDDSVPDRWAVAPGPITARDHLVEPDLSNAAPFLALAAVSGGRVVVRDWPRSTTQAGAATADILGRMGCDVALVDEGLAVTGPQRLRGVDEDMHDVGELTPAVAALCALAESPSRLTGIGHVRGHETDRLAALATEINGLGGHVVEHPDGLEIHPAPLHPGVFHTYADHRMAHAGVILAAAVEGVTVENIATTSKTFPDFAAYWSGLWAARV